tara:strand:- start:31 stop:417 length:387 start_codon:yes stop_codon:yes gene_type:complete
MAGINFRTDSDFVSVTGNSASTTSNPNNATLLFTCPQSHEAEIVFLMVANEDNSTSNIGIQIFNAENNTYHSLVGEEAIAGHSNKQFIGGGPLFLHAGDKILIFRHTSSQNFDATLSARLYFTPAKRL